VWTKQEKIAERGLDEAAAPHEVTAAYTDFMRGLRGKPYAVLSVAFWAIEYAYNQASGPGSPHVLFKPLIAGMALWGPTLCQLRSQEEKPVECWTIARPDNCASNAGSSSFL